MVGIIADRTGEIRLGFAFLFVLLALPIPILLWRVNVEVGHADAHQYSQEEALMVVQDDI